MAKKKTLATMFEDFGEETPSCPNCEPPTRVVKSGVRTLKEDTYQIYLCRTCNRRFSDRTLPHTSYPPKLILSALSYYNTGHTLDQTARAMRRFYRVKVPVSTLHGWVKRYGGELPFTKLRKRYDLDPSTTIRTRRLFHPQPYLFRVHSLKLNIAGKRFPGLKSYINGMLTDPKDYIFQSKTVLRCSELAKSIDVQPPRTRAIKDSMAPRMCGLALELARTKKERHEKVEGFFLTNDSVTVAIELPLYLTEKESGRQAPVTGHIDMVQARGNSIYIMDYKPERDPHVHAQLTFYAQLLKRRTGHSDIMCAYFNENGYVQFRPEV